MFENSSLAQEWDLCAGRLFSHNLEIIPSLHVFHVFHVLLLISCYEILSNIWDSFTKGIEIVISDDAVSNFNYIRPYSLIQFVNLPDPWIWLS